MINKNQIELINQDISKANEILDDGDIDEIKDICDRLNRKYKLKLDLIIAYDFKEGPARYKEYCKLLNEIIDQMKYYQAELKDADNQNSMHSKLAESININNTNTATNNITQNISIKSTIEKIDQIPDEILAKNLKRELKGMLSELENCKNSQEKKSKLMEVVKWLGDKTADAFIACLPYFAGLDL